MMKVTLGLALLLGLAAGSSAMAQTAQTSPSPAAGPPAASAPAATNGPLIDINSASRDELEALTGIGPARAEAIVKGRPYKGKDELHRKGIIPESVYEGIKDKIIARQS